MTMLTCWALCAALVSADDKPKADEAKKPATAAEAVAALEKARTARARTIEEVAANQDKVISAADAVLAFKDATDKQKDTALSRKATALFAKGNLKPDQAAAFEEFATTLEKEHPQSAAVGTVAMLKFQKKHMQQLRNRTAKMEPAVVEELLQLGKKYPKEQNFASLYGMFAGRVESTDGKDAAIKFLENGLKVFEGNTRLTGALNGLKVMGNRMELVGPTLEGSEFNVANLKGKVVLVDYWATWCGPCVQVLPEVKEAYEKHHGKGFEIVGVSLDQKREALEKFVKEKEIPWTQVIFSKPDEMYWSNPLAVKYGVNSIPATFLIGRDGKVVAKDLHGENLEKAIAEELAKSAPSAN